MRVHQQTETEEHDNLEKPCQSIHKRVNLFAVHDFVVTHHHAGNVDGEVSVALHQIGNGEGKEYERQQQNGVERLVVYIQPVEHKDGQLAQQIAGSSTYHKLYHERESYLRSTHTRGLDELDKYDSQHIGHRVVASAFQLQHGTQIVLQVHLLRAQDGEYRCRVRRRHGGSQQQGGDERQVDIGPAHARQPPYKQSGKQCRQQHTESRQYNTGGEDRLDFGELGIHSARKQDNAQSHHTDELRFFGVVELQSESVAAEKHAHHKKK